MASSVPQASTAATTLVRVDQLDDLVSYEARQLIVRCSLSQCMWFIYNTGVDTCTGYCCQTSDQAPPQIFGPEIDPGLSPSKIHTVTKLAQWSIHNDAWDCSDDYKIATDYQEIAWVISKCYEAQPKVDRPGRLEPPRHVYKAIRRRSAYTMERDSQRRDPTIGRRADELKHKREDVHDQFENNFLFSEVPCRVSTAVFWSVPSNGYDEFSKAYLAWRKIWHTFVFRTDPERLSVRMKIVKSIIGDAVSKVRMWGNIENDFSLYHYQELTRDDLRYTYDQEPETL
ncbi:hypothetical protein QQX98_010032 [Neonectria punicea]|uniref:Uncharacterized protein n=1 Tax=Neonectria punicea TaxID=979145 RepID=A0ABR1GQW2_9HYPO